MTAKPTPLASPESFLSLSAVVFEILLALAGSDLHGYDIMREVEQRSGGGVTLHPGTLYRALHRLLNDRLVEELDDRPDPALDDERRRYYRLTKAGHAVASVEARRLASQVQVARARRLLKGSTS
jgi:DNA-binding PadR family transcriptional regulator